MKKSWAASVLVAAAFFAATPGAQASSIRLTGNLSGAAEVPPTGSPGTGMTFVILDTFAHTLRVNVTFSGLTTPTVAAHIHCCTAVPGVGVAGVATTLPAFGGFPLGVTSGALDRTYDLTLPTSWNGAFITAHGGTTAGAEAFFTTGILAGETYLNIHTTAFPTGEIRSFLQVAQVIPEPDMAGLLAIGVAAIVMTLRRRRR